MKKRYVIRPLAGVGPIVFGMSLDEVSGALGSVPDVVQPPDPFLGDISCRYAKAGVVVIFDSAGTCAAVSTAPPDYADFDFDGVCLSTMGYRELVTWVQRHDRTAILEQDSVRSDGLGIFANSPEACDPENEDPETEGIVAYRPGYFTRMDEWRTRNRRS
jgi:hypothetical protein